MITEILLNTIMITEILLNTIMITEILLNTIMIAMTNDNQPRRKLPTNSVV
jgi:hypothetical protein